MNRTAPFRFAFLSAFSMPRSRHPRPSFARTLQKGQLITLEGTLRYREVTEDVEGASFKHRIAEIHATSMKRLSKVDVTDDPADGAGDE